MPTTAPPPITRATAEMLRQAMDIAIGAHLKPLGDNLELGRASFSADVFTVKVNIVRASGGVVTDRYARAWEQHKHLLGGKTDRATRLLEPGMIGTLQPRVISSRFHKVKFRGVMPRYRTRPFVIECTRTGKLYRVNSLAQYNFEAPPESGTTSA